MICFIMIDHESVIKAGKVAASLNDFVYYRVACEFTPGGTKVWFNTWLYFTSFIHICKVTKGIKYM